MIQKLEDLFNSYCEVVNDIFNSSNWFIRACGVFGFIFGVGAACIVLSPFLIYGFFVWAKQNVTDKRVYRAAKHTSYIEIPLKNRRVCLSNEEFNEAVDRFDISRNFKKDFRGLTK